MAAGFLRSGACALFVACASAPPAAGADVCSCKNLESLQQELENALFEATFFSDLSGRLREIEQKQIEVNKDPTHRDSGLSVLAASANARAEIMAREFNLPHPQVAGDTGPKSVEMTPNTCKQPQALLDALGNGAACKEIGDIVLEHEAAHRRKCELDGADKYWARLPSEMAAEEAVRYAEQAAAMRNLLKRVIDNGTFKVSAEMEPRLNSPQFDVTYSYVTAPVDMEGLSSPGSDSWRLEGSGKQIGTIKQAKIAGMNCSGYGQLNDRANFTMDTDGLTMSLSERTDSTPGDIGIRCDEGFGMSMRPGGDSGAGSLISGERLKLLIEQVRDISTFEFAKIMAQGGMSVSGKHRTTVELVCPGFGAE